MATYRWRSSDLIESYSGRFMATTKIKRNNLNIWFLQKRGWTTIQVPTEKIMEAGGVIYQDHNGKSVASNQVVGMLDMVFQCGDRGVATMRDWCANSCRDKWQYEPAGCFLFRSFRDAVLFKLTWF